MTPDTEVQFYRKVSDLNLKTNSEDLFWRAVLFWFLKTFLWLFGKLQALKVSR